MNEKLNEIFKNKLRNQTTHATSYINEKGELIKYRPNFDKMHDTIKEEAIHDIEEVKKLLKEHKKNEADFEKKYTSIIQNLENTQVEDDKLGHVLKATKEERGNLRMKRRSSKPKRKLCRCK
jgi:hypothetical protein